MRWTILIGKQLNHRKLSKDTITDKTKHITIILLSSFWRMTTPTVQNWKLQTTQSQAKEKKTASLLLKSYSWSHQAYLGMKMFCS